MMRLVKSKIVKTNNPSTLRPQLYPYQKLGVQWIKKTLEKHKGCILADDVGTGKTPQSITFLKDSIKENKITKEESALIVVPKTLQPNWYKEIEKHAPELLDEIANEKIRIVTYTYVRKNIEKLKQEKYFIIIIDEAQNIKSVKSKISQAIKKLRFKYYLAITATPMENNFREFMNILDPAGLVPDKCWTYMEKLRNIEIEIKDKEIIDKLTSAFHEYISEAFKHCILRRTKSQVLLSLTNYIQEDIFCILSEEQSKEFDRYNKMLKEKGWRGFHDARKGCNEEEFIKIVETIKLIKKLDPDEKMIIFSDVLDTLYLLQKTIEEELNMKSLIMEGETSLKKRNEIIEEINYSLEHRIFLISKGVGGLGLTLTAANVVVLIEPWWNYAREYQAIGRVHRNTQTRKVRVYRLRTNTDFENSMIQLQEKKAKDSSGIMQSYTVTNPNDPKEYDRTFDPDHQKKLLAKLAAQIDPEYKKTRMYAIRRNMIQHYAWERCLKLPDNMTEDESDEYRYIIAKIRGNATKHNGTYKTPTTTTTLL